MTISQNTNQTKAKPMDFQINGAKRLCEILQDNSRAFLADEPGLGKTFTATLVIRNRAKDFFKKKENAGRNYYVIYIGPNSDLTIKNCRDIVSKYNDVKELGDREMYSPIRTKCQVVIDGLNEYIDKYFGRLKKTDKAIEDEKETDINNSRKMKKVKAEVEEKILAFFNSDEHDNIRNELKYLIDNEIRKLIGEGATKKLWKKYIRSWYDSVEKTGSVLDAYNYIKNIDVKGQIILIPLSCHMIGDRENTAEDDKDKINAVLKSYKINYSVDYPVSSFERCFLNTYQPDLLLIDEFHRYHNKVVENSGSAGNLKAFLEYEKVGNMKCIFISATPFSTLTSGENKEGYDELASYDEKLTDDKLPSFDEFVKLFNGGNTGKNLMAELHINYVESLNKWMEDDTNENFDTLKDNRDKYQEVLYSKMVRHERTLLASKDGDYIPEPHRILISDDDIYTDENKQIFRNEFDYVQKFRKAFPEVRDGAIKWGLKLPGILSFSTRTGRSLTTGKNKYWDSMIPDTLCQKKQDYDVAEMRKLFLPENEIVYESWLREELQKSNLSFWQIMFGNEFSNDSDLLAWVPATIPLYSAGERSIFAKNSSYSKMLIFAEYTYLRRGLSGILSDYVVARANKVITEALEKYPGFREYCFQCGGIDKLKLSFSKTYEEESCEPYNWIKDYCDHSGKKLKESKKLEDIINELVASFGPEIGEDAKRAEALRRIASPYACAEAAGFPHKALFQDAFTVYINSNGVKESILRWMFSEYNPRLGTIPKTSEKFEEWLELSLLQYCAEGNLYSVLKEWIFVNNGKVPSEEAISDIFSFGGSTVYYQTCSSMFTEKQDTDEQGKQIRMQVENISKTPKPIKRKCRYSERLTGDIADNGTGQSGDEDRQKMAKYFSAPFWPMIMSAGRGAQEGMDFHQYCLKLAHLTIPKGSVSMEQRQGRIDRFRSLLIRRRAAEYAAEYECETRMDILEDLFSTLKYEKNNSDNMNNEIFPNWSIPAKDNSNTALYEIVPFWRFTEEAREYSSCVNQAINYRVGFGATYSEKLNERLRKITPEDRDAIMINLAAKKHG